MDVVNSIVSRVKLTYCDNEPLPIPDIINSNNSQGGLQLFLEWVNVSIENKVFPETEKLAIVKPIVKGKLDSQCLSSYRLVSNLTFLSKIIENVILNQFLEYLQAVEALPDNRAVYKRLYSTETALCLVVNKLLLLMDEGKCGIFILLDLNAAFDSVVHSLLLADCKTLGIDEDALDYLTRKLLYASQKVSRETAVRLLEGRFSHCYQKVAETCMTLNLCMQVV